MAEGLKQQEIRDSNSVERQSEPKTVFEHLFPGCLFDSLPGHNLRSIPRVGLKVAQGALGDTRLMRATQRGETYAELVNFPPLNKFYLSYELEGAQPANMETNGVCLNGHSFTDMVDVDEGEKLGGVATRRLRCYYDGYTSVGLVGANPFAVANELLIGILDKDGKPKGYIRLVEGEGKRKPVRKEERLPFRVALTLPEMRVERVTVR